MGPSPWGTCHLVAGCMCGPAGAVQGRGAESSEGQESPYEDGQHQEPAAEREGRSRGRMGTGVREGWEGGRGGEGREEEEWELERAEMHKNPRWVRDHTEGAGPPLAAEPQARTPQRSVTLPPAPPFILRLHLFSGSLLQ